MFYASHLVRALVVLMCAWAFPVIAALPANVAVKDANAGATLSRAAWDQVDAASRPPIADAGPDVATMVGTPAAIDGSASFDPAGRRITFHWSLVQAPAGSAATLATGDPAPNITPDVPGNYRLQLVVVTDDGIASNPAQTTLVAYDTVPAPNARAGKNRAARVGSSTRLDAGASYDPLQTPLSYRWSLVAAPDGSRITGADIVAHDTATPSFTPDVSGDYLFEVEAGNGARTANDRMIITATDGNLPPLAYAGDHQTIRKGASLVLDGRASFDPDNAPTALQFAWSLVARPEASTITGTSIGDATSATASVVLDAAGPYVFRLTVSDGDRTDADNVLVRVGTETTKESDEAATRNVRAAAASAIAQSAPTTTSRRLPIDLSLTVGPAELVVPAGGEGTFAIRFRGRSSDVSDPSFSVDGLASGITGAFAVITQEQRAALQLRIDPKARPGRYPLQVSLTGTVGHTQLARSSPVTLVIGDAVAATAAPTTCRGANLSALRNVIAVAPNGVDSATCGGAAVSACATIQKGIDNCNGAGCAVLVRYGRYTPTATIRLRDGVSIHGSCIFAGEQPPDPVVAANYRTIVDASPPPGAPAISGDSINTPTLISGLVILGKKETVVGEATIVMAASNSRGITLQNSALIAGQGGPGASAAPIPAGGPGQTGNAPSGASPTVGGAGGAACAPAPVPVAGRGGQGADHQNMTASCGDWYCSCTNTNPKDSVGRTGAGAGGGTGGGAASIGCGCQRADGVPDGPSGNPGAPGACGYDGGTAGDAFGSFAGVHWLPGSGRGGGGASVGSGGGGGGSGGMSAYTNFSKSVLYPGLPGGGGGGGGCGGTGGAGGGQGGASIALVLNASTIASVAEVNTVVPGIGGKGGDGSNGGIGGFGGPGGAGAKGHTVDIGRKWTCTADGPGSGGPGGAGGQGGAGSGGAAGSGGPAYGVALVGGSTATGASTPYDGRPGVPGTRGSGGQNAVQPGLQPNPCKGANGNDAILGADLAVVNADEISPARLLLPGQQLLPSQSLSSPNGLTSLLAQTDGNLCVYVQTPKGQTNPWCSSTQYPAPVNLIMQDDGNLVFYGPNGYDIFDTGTQNHAGAYLAVQDNGKAVIYFEGKALWTSK